MDLAVLQVMSQKDHAPLNRYGGNRWLDPMVDGKKRRNPEAFTKAQSPVWKPIRFKTNSDVLPSGVDQELELIAEAVRNHFRTIIVHGNCTEEEASRDGAGGDDLAFRRALAVKNKLKSLGIANSRISIVSQSCNAKLEHLKTTDRKLALVTLGEYFLPGNKDLISDNVIQDDEPKKESDSKSHSGH